jgi:hypothetical protein
LVRCSHLVKKCSGICVSERDQTCAGGIAPASIRSRLVAL